MGFSLFTLKPNLKGPVGLRIVQTFVLPDLTLSLTFVAFLVSGNVFLMPHVLTHNLDRVSWHTDDCSDLLGLSLKPGG